MCKRPGRATWGSPVLKNKECLKNSLYQGWGDGSAAQPQHTWQPTAAPPVPGDPVPSSGLHGHWMYMCTYMPVRNTRVHKIKSQNTSVFSMLMKTRFMYLFISAFWGKVSLGSLGCPRTHFVDQVGFELGDLPVLGLKVGATKIS